METVLKSRIPLTLLLLAGTLLAPARNVQGQDSRKAFFLSLILPGAGQYYAGERKAAQSFLCAELGIWTSFAGFRKYAAMRENDYRVFARTHAGASVRGKDETFLEDLGFYTDVYEHNRFARWKEGPEGRIYPETEGWVWEWDSESSRRRYRRLRESGISADRRSLYMVGTAVLNRIVSAIHAARSARRPNSRFPSGEERSLQMNFWMRGDELRCALVRPL